ncbi:MAG: hypothetical protein QME07_04050 [bacterium]|nr:hypothetical protein [bacterium]
MEAKIERFTLILLIAAFGANVYGIWAGPIHKQKVSFVPPEKGTPTNRMLSSKALQLQKEFKKRFPEYTLMGFSTDYLNRWYNSDKASYEYTREYYKSRGTKPSSQPLSIWRSHS